jgi:signal transduction histidine kinase
MIDDVANMVRPMMKKNDNNFSIATPDDLGVMHADITRVKQVLFNLLSNASKFTTRGRIELLVENDERGYIDFKIVDTGIGIESDKIDKLFQEFVQADDSTTRVYGGTGLGLSICRRLSLLMGGDILVSSTLGVGSTFVAHLPRRVKINQILE